MAKMIPSVIDANTKSGAEKKIFSLFRDMPDTENWTVLHSVRIAAHATQSQGEADFVVIIPDGGVFVLEVKGGGIDYCDGKWYSTDRAGVSHILKNPIDEASNAMHSLRDYIASHKDNIANLHKALWGFGIVLPDCSFHGKICCPDIDDHQVADYGDTINIKAYLLNLAHFWNGRKTPGIFVPTQAQTKQICNMLRPNAHGSISVSDQIKITENQNIVLTQQQEEVFEGLFDNERCLIRGSAGTGKTLLALKYAKEQAVLGKRVALFCYNVKLAKYLQSSLSLKESVVCGSFSEYMLNVLQKVYPDRIQREIQENRDVFFRTKLPELFYNVFNELSIEQVDCLILDEAQDLMIPEYLYVLDLLLKGGLKNGQWYFFMDSENQNLYHSTITFKAARDLLNEFSSFYANYRLTENCRNSLSIIEKIDQVFGTHSRYRTGLDKGADVTTSVYKKGKDQLEILTGILSKLERENVNREDIVLLSPFRFRNSVASALPTKVISENLYDRKNCYYFSTVSGFKGLESPVVILIDFDSFPRDLDKYQLYVGMTRARSALYLVLSEHARQDMMKIRK